MNTLTLQRENLHIVSTNSSLSRTNNYGYQPIAAGEYVTNFYLPAQHVVTKHSITGSLTRETYISLQDFLDDQQPLVIAFLGAPGQAAVSVQQLEQLHVAVQNHGGKLLVVTAIEPKHLRRQLKQSNTLNIVYDKDNTVSELFGLYDTQNPLWQWVSGIEEEEQSLPALYIITADSKVAFAYADYNFSLFTSGSYALQTVTKELLNTVDEVSVQYQLPEAYKLVS